VIAKHGGRMRTRVRPCRCRRTRDRSRAPPLPPYGVRVDLAGRHLRALHESALEVLDGAFDGREPRSSAGASRAGRSQLTGPESAMRSHAWRMMRTLWRSSPRRMRKRSRLSPFLPSGMSKSTSSYFRYGCDLRTSYATPLARKARAGPRERDGVLAGDVPDAFPGDRGRIRFLSSMPSPSSTSCMTPAARLAGRASFSAGVGGFAHAADATERVRETSAGLLLEDVPDHLARLDEPEERRERAELHRHRAGAREVVGHAGELAQDHAVPLAALGDGDLAHLLDGQRVADVVEHRRDVVQAIDVREDLGPGPALAHLLEAAVQIGRSARPLFTIVSPESSRTMRTVPCIAGCDGPMLRCIGSEGSSSSFLRRGEVDGSMSAFSEVAFGGSRSRGVGTACPRRVRTARAFRGRQTRFDSVRYGTSGCVRSRDSP